MKVLVLGTGAKDTAITWWFSKSTQIEALYMAPGNPGVKDFAINLSDVDITSGSDVYKAVTDYSIDLVFIGTEAPLTHGVTDYLIKKKVPVCGAPLKSLKLDSDRIFARTFAQKYNIPIPRFKEFKTTEELKEYLKKNSADSEADSGLSLAEDTSGENASALKFVASSASDAGKAEKRKYTFKLNTMGPSRDITVSSDKNKILMYAEAHLENDTFILEEFISGIPITFTAFIDENGILPLPLCSEYTKREHDDTGVVTGGMGSVCPVPLDKHIVKIIQERIIKPTLAGLKKEKMMFKGIITFAMVLKDDSPFLVDYHLRLNDPATQSIVPLVKNDLCSIMDAMMKGALSGETLETNGKSAVGTVVASLGYPYNPQVNCRLEDIPGNLTLSTNYTDCYTFLGAVKEESGSLITTGGRVATVVGVSDNIINAGKVTYKNIDNIRFNGAWYRKDIGQKFYNSYLENMSE